MSLEGRVALVTGGGRGIGRAIAIGLAQDGADVAVNYRRDAAAARDTVAAITALGRRAEAYQAAVDRFEDDERLVESVVADFGQLDILIHNAGIASRGKAVRDTDPAELERVLRVHALAPHVLSKLAIPHLERRPRGDIVMISSVATQQYAPRGAPYNMGKAAQEALAFTLAKEVRKHNIRVNIVAPGLVETEMGRRLIRATAGVKDLRELDASMPFGRVCQPEDVANAVRFLCSDLASYVSGEKINIYAGGPSPF